MYGKIHLSWLFDYPVLEVADAQAMKAILSEKVFFFFFFSEIIMIPEFTNNSKKKSIQIMIEVL